MSNILAANITTTILNRRLYEVSNKRAFNVQLAFGNGTLTYPSGGIITTSNTFGLPNSIESCDVYDNGASGFKWEYVRSTGALRCFQSRNLDWVAFTPTSSWTANTTLTGLVKMSGDTGDFQVHIALAGAPTSAALTVTLPTAYTVDTTKMLGSVADGQCVGYGSFSHSSAVGHYICQWNYTSPQQVDVYFISSVSTAALTAVDATHTETWANNDTLDLRFSLPVTGFGGNQLNGLYEPAGVAIAAQNIKCEVVGW